jgi:hypothetical protein
MAQSAAPDPSLLTTTLTPMGAERVGNADGSIPAWTGGLTALPLPASQSVSAHLFEDERPLYTVNANNMAQYAHLLTEGTKAQITKFGLSLQVFPTHRTAAAPQYIYDNAAKNVTRAQLDPAGGRLGFTGGYGGPPFPIIDTATPLTGGAQLIWNHLTSWDGYSTLTLFDPGCVVIDGRVTLVAATKAQVIYPYYDPSGSPETFDGYYSKGHYYDVAPSAVEGQETLVWHSTNVNIHPDIVWSLLNGQGRVRKDPDEAFDAPNPDSNGISNIDESVCFYGNPSEYDWTFIEKKEMLVPYNCNKLLFHTVQEYLGPNFVRPEFLRWEKHRVWVVEATLHPGQHNVIARRRFYIDEDSWFALLGEGYDATGALTKAYAVYNECVPSLPGTIELCTATFDLMSGNYVFNGKSNYGTSLNGEFLGPQPASAFEPQEMAANASF